MRALLRPEGLVLRAEDGDDERELWRMYRHGHLHFVCKTVRASGRAHVRGGQCPGCRKELLLTPSVIRWQRPARRKRKP